MNTLIIPNLSGDLFITTATLQEIKSSTASHLYATFAANHNISTLDPDTKSISVVKASCAEIGQKSLSVVDIEVLALALMLSKNDRITILSDDYGLRNVAHQLKISSKGSKTTGGGEKRIYNYLCKACSKKYSNEVNDCEVCGSIIFKRIRKH